MREHRKLSSASSWRESMRRSAPAQNRSPKMRRRGVSDERTIRSPIAQRRAAPPPRRRRRPIRRGGQAKSGARIARHVGGRGLKRRGQRRVRANHAFDEAGGSMAQRPSLRAQRRRDPRSRVVTEAARSVVRCRSRWGAPRRVRNGSAGARLEIGAAVARHRACTAAAVLLVLRPNPRRHSFPSGSGGSPLPPPPRPLAAPGTGRSRSLAVSEGGRAGGASAARCGGASRHSTQTVPARASA